MLSAKKMALIAVSVVGVGCSPNLKNVDEDQKAEEGAFDPNNPEVVDVGVSVSENSQAAFRLASATAFTMSLEDCVSGYTSTADEGSPNLQVYKYDQECLAKLTAFSYNGSDFEPSAGDPFTTWLAGDAAIFEDVLDNTNIMRVRVVSQLDSPISGTEPVEYLFSVIEQGSNENIADTVVGAAHAMQVDGLLPPALTISSVTYDGMTSDGEGLFTFTMECDSAVTGTGATRACEGLLLDKIKYRLVEDTYSSTLDISDAEALFPAGEYSIANPGDHLDTGAGGTTNGGFLTSSIEGPEQMHLFPHMILIFQADDTSYLYFNVDVTTLTQL
ncbi:MAG: hypothetical protein AB7T49_08015 [Oligoflexales bacterium]